MTNAEPIKYTVFRTTFGFFGLVGTDNGLLRSHLPSESRREVESSLLAGLEAVSEDRDYLPSLQQKITSYFEGVYVDFGDNIPLNISNLCPFASKVLTACRKIRYGQTVSYSRLAELAGHPKAARAIGTVLARNPMPLIIPCHRVICSNGKIGGFSASGGTELKGEMLRIEREAAM